MYQALYRKWRPRTFDDVVGQAHITDTLKKQVETGHLSHAYLFIGTRGTGKTTCAKILARAVNCEHPVNGNPCNECDACRGIESGGVMDVVELDAASNNGVDNVRALRDEAIFTPASVRKRVYIIDEVHMLSSSAFNALLKILEEPPEHLMFILCTTEARKVLPTIVSRCQRHSFKRLSPEDISGRLKYVATREQLRLTDGAAEMLARLADGGMRDGLSLLDQCSGAENIDEAAVLSAMGLSGTQHTAELLDHVLARDVPATLNLFDRLWNDGKDPFTVLEELATLLRDILLIKVAPKGCEGLISGSYAPEKLRGYAGRFSADELMANLEQLHTATAGGDNPRRRAELCLIGLCTPDSGDSVARLRARVARLERALQNGISIPAPAAEAAPNAPSAEPASRQAAEAYTYPLPEKPELMVFEEPAPAPISEPEPAKEPAPAPASESPAAETAPAAGDAFWPALLEKLRGKLDIGTYSLLAPPSQVSGTCENGVFTLQLPPNPFVRTMLEMPANSVILQEAAASLTGGPVQLRLVDAAAQAGTADLNRLNADLSGFSDFIKFE